MPSSPERTAADTLRRIKSLHRRLIAVLVGYLPLVVLLYLFQAPELLIISSAFLLVCVGIGLAFLIGYARCPSCGRFFHIRGMTGNIFGGKCMHCGLRI